MPSGKPNGNSLAEKYPEIASQWHPTKNGKLTPEDVTFGSHKHVWWLYPYDDPATGKHFDFEWKARINGRTDKEGGCPFISKRPSAYPGFNDLATTHPELAKEWHPVKNGKLTPKDVVAGSQRRVWWLYPYDDPATGKHFDFEWEASVVSRTTNKMRAPHLSNRAVCPGFNDLATTHPELAKEWHPVKNGELTPKDIVASSHKKVWWFLPYDDPVTGKHFDFEWEATLFNRTFVGSGCPYFSNGAKVYPGFNDLATLCPEVAKEWHPTKNGALKPEGVTKASSRFVWWQRGVVDNETGETKMHEWQSQVNSRTAQRRKHLELSRKGSKHAR